MYILNFQDITKKDIDKAGGKGANLGEMTRAGIPVPPGAVLATAAYQRFMKDNEIDISAGPEKIREKIRAGSIPEEIKAEIAAFYQSMEERYGGKADKAVRMAIRSSATAEDLADASFAGQQETFLNVQGEDMLMDSIKSCYASLWGKRAVSYRREKGYDRQPPALAVVIQLMVESETAGVLFTQNPANGKKEEMVINASYGLGESVVSGAVSPDELVCGREGQILRQVIGSKETMVVYGERGVITVPVETEKRSMLSLTPGQITKLVQTGREIEAHYQAPMDIEWAFAGRELYILQARAITAKAEKTFDETVMPAIQPINKRMREALLFTLEKEPFSYYPLDYDFSMILGRQKAVIFAEAGINIDNECGIDENGFMSLPALKFSLGKNIRYLPSMLGKMKNHPENIRKAKTALEAAKQKAGWFAERDYSRMEIADCLKALTELYYLISDTAYVRFRYAVFPGFMMNRSLEKYLKKTDETLTAYNLLEGLSYKTADMNRDLQALAKRLSEDSEVYDAKEAVLSGKSYEEIIKQFPTVGKWFEKFFEKYEYKSDFNCYCFTAKTWKEDKARFLQVLKPLLTTQSGKEMSLEEGNERYGKLLEEMTAGCTEKQAKKVRELTEAYRFYHVFREETQYLWEMAFYACRRVLKRAAELLDITETELLYLYWEELQAAMKRGGLDRADREKISRRKGLRPAVEEYWKRQQWEALKGEGEYLKGISGSTGEARGEVCIVTAPAEFGKLKKGDILVCPYTDPEWTPLFTLAAAVVSDTGGALSHAAIVAREYKIPAVLAVGSATRRLKDGDRVFVNGTAGEVRRM